MKNIVKGKFFTVLTVVVTLVLAGVAIFTAFRLYQLRQESVSPASPESEPAAWDCRNYTFSVNSTGVVSVNNSSIRNESPQKAKVYINNQLQATLDVPALPQGQSATLGTVNVPSGQSFTWKVIGTVDCQNSGTVTAVPVSCTELTFSITAVTITPTPTSSPTPTPTTPVGCNQSCTSDDNCEGNLICSNNHCRNASCSGETDCVCSTPAPTTQQIAQVTPTPGGLTLPDAGISTPTLFGLSLGILLIMAALLLAI